MKTKLIYVIDKHGNLRADNYKEPIIGLFYIDEELYFITNK
jgi:hypothetical protein